MRALQYGKHQPTLYIVGTSSKGIAILEDFPDEHDRKVKLMFGAGAKIASDSNLGKLNKVFFVTEAWMSPARKDYVRPSKDPDRIEALIVNCLDVLTKEQTLEGFEYVRDEKGSLTELKPLPMPKDIRVDGMLLPAFVAGFVTGS